MLPGQYIRTNEIREKNRNALLGRKLSKETIEKIGNSNRGKIRSDESKKKYSLAKLGRPRPQHVKDRLREIAKQRTREKNTNWRGGKTPLIISIRTSYKYNQWRLDVFERDSFICRVCGEKSSGNIEAHHIIKLASLIHQHSIHNIEKAILCRGLWDLDNGLTLCLECHKLTDNYKFKGGMNKCLYSF